MLSRSWYSRKWKRLKYLCWKKLFPISFCLLAAQPKTHSVLPEVGFQPSAVWGEIQTVNSCKLSSSALRYLQKKAILPWRTFRPQQWSSVSHDADRSISSINNNSLWSLCNFDKICPVAGLQWQRERMCFHFIGIASGYITAFGRYWWKKLPRE